MNGFKSALEELTHILKSNLFKYNNKNTNHELKMQLNACMYRWYGKSNQIFDVELISDGNKLEVIPNSLATLIIFSGLEDIPFTRIMRYGQYVGSKGIYTLRYTLDEIPRPRVHKYHAEVQAS